jgi:hypothetical protein
MGVKHRIALAVVLAAAVFGGLMPHVIGSAERSTASLVSTIFEEPLSGHNFCIDAVCGKGSPTPAAPTTPVGLAAFLASILITAEYVSAVRRRRHRVAALPRGARDPLFHPPQFS